MFTKFAKSIMCAAIGTAVLAAGLASTEPAHAGCRGFFCGLVQDIPVIGPAAQGGDEWIAGMKERGSSEDVLNQGTSLNSWNNPIGRPAAPPPTVPMGRQTLPFCATPAGMFGPLPPPGAPNGTSCWWRFPNGQTVYGQIAWQG